MVKLQDFEVPEEAFDNPLISLHLKCMRSFGYIVSNKQQKKRLHLRKCAILIVTFIMCCSLLFINLSKGFANLADGAISCAVAFTYLSFSIAIVNAFVQRKRVVRMVKFIHDDITALFRITDAEEEIMLMKTTKYIRVTTLILWTCTLAAAFIVSFDCLYRTVFKTNTVFNRPEVLNGKAQPILLYRLFPFREVYDNFIVGYLGPFYIVYLAIAIIPCWHTFVMCLMKYIVFKYAIISKRLSDYDFRKLSSDLNFEKLKTLTKRNVLYWHTKMCEFGVQEQLELRWFTKELESLIRIPVFLDFILFSVLICFIFYAIAVGNPSNMDCFFFAMYIFIMAFMLWLYHWHATLITESNEKFRFALYSSPWYTFPVTIQKNIRLMMTESNRPLVMKAFFIELNLKTFLDIMRGAYSYFSILRNVRLEQDPGN